MIFKFQTIYYFIISYLSNVIVRSKNYKYVETLVGVKGIWNWPKVGRRASGGRVCVFTMHPPLTSPVSECSVFASCESGAVWPPPWCAGWVDVSARILLLVQINITWSTQFIDITTQKRQRDFYSLSRGCSVHNQ